MRSLTGAATALAFLAAVPQATRSQTAETCVEAQVGAERAYSCVNDALARAAQAAHAALATNTLAATSPAPAVGTFNRTATAERMGNAFGHSVISQRPPPDTFVSPLLLRAR